MYVCVGEGAVGQKKGQARFGRKVPSGMDTPSLNYLLDNQVERSFRHTDRQVIALGRGSEVRDGDWNRET